jgi:hypothetical protein
MVHHVFKKSGRYVIHLAWHDLLGGGNSGTLNLTVLPHR